MRTFIRSRHGRRQKIVETPDWAFPVTPPDRPLAGPILAALLLLLAVLLWLRQLS